MWRDFIAVTFSVAVLGIGLGSTLPLTALILSARGLGPGVVGWMVAAVALGGMAGTLAAPSVTLRFGRRNVMLACLLIAAASTMPLQYASSLPAWAALRFLFGLSMAPLFVLGESWINVMPADAVRGRIVAIYTTSFTACQVLGPALTNWLTHYPDRAMLICGGVFLLGAPGIALARSDEASHEPGHSAERDNKDSTLSWLGILGRAPVIIAGTAFFAAFDNIMLSFLPLFGLDAGLSQSQALTAVVVVLAGDATLQFGAGWLADHYGRGRVHWLCAVAVCLLLPLLPLMVHLPGWWELYLYLLGGFAGAIYTLSMVASGEYFSGAALLRAAGLIGMTWNVASSAGAAATGAMMQAFGAPAMVAVLWLMAMGFALLAFRRRHGG